MSINTNDLNSEREILVNAVHGAIQQVDKFIKMSENNKKIPDEKEKALNIATG